MRIEAIQHHMIGKYKRFSGIESLTHFLTTVLLVQFTTFYLFVQQPQKMGVNGCSFRELSGYHADTPITIKAEAIHEADSRIH